MEMTMTDAKAPAYFLSIEKFEAAVEGIVAHAVAMATTLIETQGLQVRIDAFAESLPVDQRACAHATAEMSLAHHLLQKASEALDKKRAEVVYDVLK